MEEDFRGGASPARRGGVPLNMHDEPHEMLMMNNQPHHEGWKWVTGAGACAAAAQRRGREAWAPWLRPTLAQAKE